MKGLPWRVIIFAAALPIGWIVLAPDSAVAQATFLETGAGTNRCRLILNFPAGEKVVFQHRWDGDSLNAKTLLESVISATSGEWIATDGYLTPFSFAMEALTDPTTTGLVVHYQGSSSAPYLNGVRWNGPNGPTGADYQSPDNWWHVWVQGPAQVDQSYAWPDPLPPVVLAPGSAWFFGEFSGLADLTLTDGASLGLVYGSAGEPSLPAPAIRSMLSLSGDGFQLHFTSVPGARYQLEIRQDLATGFWTSWGEVIIATSASTTIFAPANSPSGRGFYRIGLLP